MKRKADSRQGAIVALSAFILTILSIIAALSINAAYIELAHTEMRLATDAAAKAGSITLGQTGSISAARRHAKAICQRHHVAGGLLRIRNSDVQFGHAAASPGGSYVFRRGMLPINAVKVNASFARRPGRTAALPAMGGFLDRNHFSMHVASVASRIDNDICLVVDRSGSMAWDTSNQEFSYPDSTNGSSIIQNYFVVPDATSSRWAALEESVDQFLTVLTTNPYSPRVALVSYSSNFDFGLYESKVSTTDQFLTYDFEQVRAAMRRIGNKPLIGNTNIAAGLRDGIMALSAQSKSRPNATHNIVLMTDGLVTQGDDPVELASKALKQNIKVHTITFSAQADQSLMQQVAVAGGGKHYHAPTKASLVRAFSELAETLPAMLIQ